MWCVPTVYVPAHPRYHWLRVYRPWEVTTTDARPGMRVTSAKAPPTHYTTPHMPGYTRTHHLPTPIAHPSVHHFLRNPNGMTVRRSEIS
jgi:hypothetical protein